ncbi:MAG: CcmD family protein [SAR202 cluster bacterium]|nr:CcmD family protein [SAR202 cluster bacterium]
MILMRYINMHQMKFKIYILPVLIGMLGFLLFSVYFGDSVYAETPANTTEIDLGPEANLDYLFAVFFLTWVAFFTYLFFLSRRLKSINKEVLLLKEFIKNKKS